ncbi:hypothetical protein ACWCQP_45965 [Streptomyces chartreusis]
MTTTDVERPAGERQDVLAGRCYTHARRHPLVIGKFPGGGRLWGGPYTIPQALVMVGTFIVLILFQQVWAHFGLLLNALIAFALPYGLGFAVRKVNVDGRNPLAVAGSMLGLMASPATGRMGGRPLKSLGRSPALGVCTVTWRERPARRRHSSAPVLIGEPGAGKDRAGRPAATTEIGTRAQGAGRPSVLSAAGALLAQRTSGTTSAAGVPRAKGA